MLNKLADFFHKITLRMEYRALKKELDEIYISRSYGEYRECDIVARLIVLNSKELF